MSAPAAFPLGVGIHRLPMADYLADPCIAPSLSSGVAHRLIAESPLHAWHAHPRLGGRPQDFSIAADVGTVVHDLLLGGEGKICEINPGDYRSKPTKDNPEGAIPGGWTNNAIREARDTARANGLTPMLSGELIGARQMVAAARTFIAASELAGMLDSGESELTVISNEGDSWLRTRPDWLNASMGVSLSFKTTQARVHPDSFARLAASMGYGFQLMFYDRCLAEAAPELGDCRHLILAQEQVRPYACALFELSPAMAAIERSQVSRAIRLWERCMDANTWPGYSGSVVHLEPKPWELAAEEERLMAEELETA